MEKYKLVIIGSGPAGLTAAIYAARADLKPLVFSGGKPGGQLMWTSTVENFPGFPEGVNGPDLMIKMMDQAKRFGAELASEDVTEIDLKAKPFRVKSAGREIESDSLIIAVGSKYRELGVSGEKEFTGKGVSTCATCDAAFFRDKEVVVVGGGDAAMEEALVLSKFAGSVKILVRSQALKASQIMENKVKSNDKIQLLWNTEVREIRGNSLVTGVMVENNQTKETSEIACAGVFVAIGQEPATGFLKDQLELNENGYIKSADEVHTNIEGVFVAGDVEDYKYRQAITAAGAGCKAALEAERFLEGNRV